MTNCMSRARFVEITWTAQPPHWLAPSCIIRVRFPSRHFIHRSKWYRETVMPAIRRPRYHFASLVWCLLGVMYRARLILSLIYHIQLHSGIWSAEFTRPLHTSLFRRVTEYVQRSCCVLCLWFHTACSSVSPVQVVSPAFSFCWHGLGSLIFLPWRMRATCLHWIDSFHSFQPWIWTQHGPHERSANIYKITEPFRP